MVSKINLGGGSSEIYNNTETYKMQDIWKNVEAKNKEEAVDICMAGRDVDENNPDYTNDIIEIYQEELHYVGGEK